MAFTYLGDLSTNLDKVRFYIGDTSNRPQAGVKPGGHNFQDAELSGLVTAEGNWQRAVAAAFEVLAALFAQEVDEGSRNNEMSEAYSQRAARYQKLSEQWRKNYGKSVGTVTVSAVTRVDGYSDDIAADEV